MASKPIYRGADFIRASLVTKGVGLVASRLGDGDGDTHRRGGARNVATRSL